MIRVASNSGSFRPHAAIALGSSPAANAAARAATNAVSIAMSASMSSGEVMDASKAIVTLAPSAVHDVTPAGAPGPARASATFARASGSGMVIVRRNITVSVGFAGR